MIPTTTVAWRDHLASKEEIAAWFAGQEEAGHPVLVATIGDEAPPTRDADAGGEPRARPVGVLTRAGGARVLGA